MIEYKFDKPVLDPEKMEKDWTYKGMKIYNFRRGINRQGSMTGTDQKDQ